MDIQNNLIDGAFKLEGMSDEIVCHIYPTSFRIDWCVLKRVKQYNRDNRLRNIEAAMKVLHIQLRTPLLRKEVVKSLESPLGDHFGREVKLRLLGQTVSVDRAALSRLWPKIGSDVTWTVEASRDGLRAAHAKLDALIRAGSSAYVPVTRFGGGHTDKSCKVRVAEVTHPAAGLGMPTITHSHTLTVPVSQLIERQGQWYAPRWLLMRAVHERIFDGKRWPVRIEGGIWLGADDLWRDLWEPMMADVDRLLAEDGAARERLAQEATARRSAEVERARRLAEQQEAQVAKKIAYEQSHHDHLARLETLSPVSVEWDDWVETRSSYGSKTREKVTKKAEDCTLKFSGGRVYILLRDGREIIKMRRNVRWTAIGTPSAIASLCT